MNKWDERFMALAHVVSKWSKDPSTKVGAVITKGNRIVSLGFNGLPAGYPDDATVLDDRKVKYALTIHAEVNAITFAKDDLTGATIYCTHAPCSNCAALIVQSGIRRVVATDPGGEFTLRWGASVALSEELYAAVGVRHDLLSP